MKKIYLLLVALFFAWTAVEAQYLENETIHFSEETEFRLISSMGSIVAQGSGRQVIMPNSAEGLYFVMTKNSVIKATVLRGRVFGFQVESLGRTRSFVWDMDKQERRVNLSGTRIDYESDFWDTWNKISEYLHRSNDGSREDPIIDNSICFNPYDGITPTELQAALDAYNADNPQDSIQYVDMELPILKEALPVYTGDELFEECDRRLAQCASEQDSIMMMKEFHYKEVAIHGSMNDSLGQYIAQCWTYTWDDLTWALQTGNGNTVCGGHSDGLLMLFDHYGFRAYNMGYGNGIAGDMGGDAATVVWSRDGTKLYLVSAMFNTGLVDQNNELLDLKEAFTRLRNGERDGVTWRGNNRKARYLREQHPVISKPGGHGPTYQWSGRTCDIHCTDYPGRYIMKAPRTAEGYLTSPYHEDEFPAIWDWWEPHIMAAGYPSSYDFNGPQDMDLFPLIIRGVYSGNNAAQAYLPAEAVQDSIATWRGFGFM